MSHAPVLTDTEEDTQRVAAALYALHKRHLDGEVVRFACCITDSKGGNNLIVSRNVTVQDLDHMAAHLQRKIRDMV